MTRRLVLVHGRAQEFKDAVALKAEWLGTLTTRLGESGLVLPLTDAEIRFPYYGQTLHDLVTGAGQVAEVIVRGTGDKAEGEFLRAVAEEMREALDIDDAEVEALLDQEVLQRGPLQWEWVHAVFKVLDRHGGSGAGIALSTRDVYQYLHNPGIRDTIERGVRQAMVPGVPTVVVSHSLGTVVAYNLLRREGQALGWEVPLLVTLGSPLAVTAIKRGLSPIEYPSCVGTWLNAADPRDVVALYPLTPAHFAVNPAIENKLDIDNHTPNRHGIAGYLNDPVVARRIHDALSV